VEQRFFSVEDDDKRRAIIHILRERQIKQAIVFVNSKLGCARLARSFERDGLRTNALHGDKSQDERLKALDAFKRGEVDVLVCTDVAARGLDIADLPAVFNFDVPFNAEDYVHRIGRTGRAGASGIAVTLVTKADARLTAEIEKLTKRKIELEALELEDERPRRAPRREGYGESSGAGSYAASPAPAPRAPRPAPASRDPFFDKPYEPSLADDARPAWEKSAPATAAAGRGGLSPYIKPKKKVAALFGAKPAPQPALAPAPQAAVQAEAQQP
jgi:superfamily II DNA/RNA helicase